MTLGTRIKEHRTKAKLSQEKVAELVGVSRQAVTKWESDQSAPTMDNLFRLAEIFGTTVDALVTDETDERSVAKLVYQMIQEDKARQRARFLEISRQRLIDGAKVLACYLILFLLCKLLWADREHLTLITWLINTYYEFHTMFFGWLLRTHWFWYAALISIAAAMLGLKRLSVTTIAGFAIGLPMGEYLGCLAGLIPEAYSVGGEVWTLMFLGSIPFGAWLQHFKPEDLTLRSKKMKRFFILCVIYAIAVPVLVLLCLPKNFYA